MNIQSVLKKYGREGDLINPRTLRQLVAHRLGLTEVALLTWPDREIPIQVLSGLDKDIIALREGMPMAYVFGFIPFLDWDFKVDERALIPRPETEALCHDLRKSLEENPPRHILDLCCGTGVMGLSLALSFPQSNLTLTDLSGPALSLAKENTVNLGMAARTTLIEGDLWNPLDADLCWDLILANPPYVGLDEVVESSVHRFEPHIALYSQDEGLSHIKAILDQIPSRLTPSGMAAFELGHHHRQLLSGMLSQRADAARFSWGDDPYDVPRYLFYRNSKNT